MSAANPRLNELLDKQAIHEVLIRYCRGVDRCDAELISSAYHPDAIDKHGSFDASGAEVGQRIVDIMRTTYKRTLHRVTNEYVVVNRDLAQGESYFMASMLFDENGGEVSLEVSGRYVDRFERRSGEWRISYRLVTIEWAYDVSLPKRRPDFIMDRAKRSREDPSYALFLHPYGD